MAVSVKGVIAPEDLGGITPFKPQIDRLKNSLVEALVKDSHSPQARKLRRNISTVHAYQGRELPFMLLSMVRGAEDLPRGISRVGTGFISPEMMNVATSRAQWSNVIVLNGDFFTRSKNRDVAQFTKHLLALAKSRGTYVRPQSGHLDEAVAKASGALKKTAAYYYQHRHETREISDEFYERIAALATGELVSFIRDNRGAAQATEEVPVTARMTPAGIMHHIQNGDAMRRGVVADILFSGFRELGLIQGAGEQIDYDEISIAKLIEEALRQNNASFGLLQEAFDEMAIPAEADEAFRARMRDLIIPYLYFITNDPEILEKSHAEISRNFISRLGEVIDKTSMNPLRSEARKTQERSELKVSADVTAKILAMARMKELFDQMFPKAYAAEVYKPLRAEDKNRFVEIYTALFEGGGDVVLPASLFEGMDDETLADFFEPLLLAAQKSKIEKPRIHIAGDADKKVYGYIFSKRFAGLFPPLSAVASRVMDISAVSEEVKAFQIKDGVAVSFTKAPSEANWQPSAIPALMWDQEALSQLKPSERLQAIHRMTQLQFIIADQLKNQPGDRIKLVGDLLGKLGIQYTPGILGLPQPELSNLLSETVGRMISSQLTQKSA